MSYSNKIAIKPFSQKYVDYYIKCFNNRINCLEGAYRAGKSVINIYSFAVYLENCFDKIHLVSGASVASARLNVSDCNGFGLSYIFRGRCKAGKYEENDCLKIKTKTGEKIVIFVGGANSDSYKRIQGLSFGSWLSVELANLYISDDEKNFIDMALSRLIQSRDPKVWWDLNPVYPKHKVYTKYLDKYAEEQKLGTFVGGYNYMTCSLFDNAALTSEQRNSFLSLYPDEESMEYQRYILGNRAAAEGLIFKQFALNKDRWVVNDLTEFFKGIKKQFISVGVDFGGNGSNTTMVASLIFNNFSGILVLKSDLIDMSDGESTVQIFNERLQKFIKEVEAMKIAEIKYLFADNADTVMVNECKQVLKQLKMYGKITVQGSHKHTIKKRIDTKRSLMIRNRWFVYKEAKTVIDSTETQVYDNREGHEDERLDNGSIDIDTADAEEYSWSAWLPKFIANNK